MHGDLTRGCENIFGRELTSVFFNVLKCKHCGGITEVIPGNPNSYTKWCCDQAREDEELKADAKAISRLKSRGYQVIKAKLRRCPKCGSAAIIMFTADEDLCTDCNYSFFPGE